MAIVAEIYRYTSSQHPMENSRNKPAPKTVKLSFLRKYLPTIIMVLVGISAILIWVYNLTIGRMPDYCDIGEAGQFGDRFGFSTSLFGAMTIALLLVTIHLQRNEIEEGRKEFKKQNRTLSFQRFETTFFNMVNLLNEIIDSKRAITQGHVAAIYSEIIRNKTSNRSYKDIYYSDSMKSNVQEEHELVRTFTRLVEHIYARKKQRSSQVKYMQILLSQLNQFEILFLYYNFLLTKNTESFFAESKRIIRAELMDIGYDIESHLTLTADIELQIVSQK